MKRAGSEEEKKMKIEAQYRPLGWLSVAGILRILIIMTVMFATISFAQKDPIVLVAWVFIAAVAFFTRMRSELTAYFVPNVRGYVLWIHATFDECHIARGRFQIRPRWAEPHLPGYVEGMMPRIRIPLGGWCSSRFAKCYHGNSSRGGTGRCFKGWSFRVVWNRERTELQLQITDPMGDTLTMDPQVFLEEFLHFDKSTRLEFTLANLFNVTKKEAQNLAIRLTRLERAGGRKDALFGDLIRLATETAEQLADKQRIGKSPEGLALRKELAFKAAGILMGWCSHFDTRPPIEEAVRGRLERLSQ